MKHVNRLSQFFAEQGNFSEKPITSGFESCQFIMDSYRPLNEAIGPITCIDGQLFDGDGTRLYDPEDFSL